MPQFERLTTVDLYWQEICTVEVKPFAVGKKKTLPMIEAIRKVVGTRRSQLNECERANLIKILLPISEVLIH